MPPRKTAAERQKQYRERLKILNPEKYKEIKQKTAVRALEYYRKKQRTLTEEQKQELRLRRKEKDQNAKNPPSETQEQNDPDHLPPEPFQRQSNRRDIRNIQHRIEQKRRKEIRELQDNMRKILTGFKTLQTKYNRQQKKLSELNETCDNLKRELNSVKVQSAETVNFFVL